MLRLTRRTFPGSAGLLTLPLLLVLACDGGPAVEDVPPPLWDEIVFVEPLLVVPGLRWFRHDEGGWYFQNRATLLVAVGQGVEGPLVISLQGEAVTLGHRFRVDWDGEALAEDRLAYGEDGLVVQLDDELLQPGPHRLTLSRDHPSEKPGARRRPRSVFGEIVFRHGEGEPVAVEPAELDRHRVVADFLQHAVAGKGKERRGGLLFVGPSRHSIQLSRTRRAKLLVKPRNLSGESAEFTVSAPGSLQVRAGVSPGGDAEIAFDVPAGESEIVLAVEGAPDGLFLWGMPRLVEGDAAKLTPIVLITLDTTRRDALGPYGRDGPLGGDRGGKHSLTPVLDRLAREATVFDEAYSTAPWTLPAHASIMTGLYPSHHGAGVSEVRLKNGMATLARLLRDRGYFTAGFSAGELSSSRFGLAQGFHYYRNPDKFETPGGALTGYLEETLAAHSGEPLFLFVNYFDAHALYQAPERFEEKLGVAELREKLRGQEVWDELLSGKMSAWRKVVEGEVDVSPEGVAYLEAAYLAEIAWIDHLLGRLFEELRTLGLYERALIIVTADHGELLGEGGYFSHAARLDPELVEIPLLVKWPGRSEPRRSARLTSLVDLYPTILAAAGVEPPPSDGLRVPGPASGATKTHPYLLLEEHSSLVHPLPKNMRLARHLFGVQRQGFRQLVWEEEQSCARRNGTPRGPWLGVACETDAAGVLAAIEERLGRRPQTDGEEVLDDLKDMLRNLGYL